MLTVYFLSLFVFRHLKMVISFCNLDCNFFRSTELHQQIFIKRQWNDNKNNNIAININYANSWLPKKLLQICLCIRNEQ